MDPLQPLNKSHIERIQKLSTQIPPHNQLEEAASELALLYTIDLEAILLGSYSQRQRDRSWRDLAEEYPDFADRILLLREALKVVPNGSLKEYFDAVEDNISRCLLGDLLWIRLGHFRTNKEVLGSEIPEMLKELEIPKEKIGQPLDIPLKLITSKLLSGELYF